MDAIKELKNFLDWNRYMTLGITLWALLVGIVVVNSEDRRICTVSNPFPGAILVIGLVFVGLFPSLELWTDCIDYKSTKSRLIVKPQLAKQGADEKPIGGAVIRFFANLFVFYLAVGITSFGWFNDDESCFFPFPVIARMWALIGAAIVGVILLIIRIGCFRYTEVKPEAEKATDEVLLEVRVHPQSITLEEVFSDIKEGIPVYFEGDQKRELFDALNQKIDRLNSKIQKISKLVKKSKFKEAERKIIALTD